MCITSLVSTEEPRLYVEFTPLSAFQDLGEVTFTIEDGIQHGCVKSEYRQLIGENTICVAAPYISSYLAGVGEFSIEKMYSINKVDTPVWTTVSLYAMAKFILNRLLTRKFDMDILYRRNTELFEENKSLEIYFLG